MPHLVSPVLSDARILAASAIFAGSYLVFALTLAGNLTVTGSVANIIVVESAKPDVHVGFWDYLRVGLPITVTTLAVGWVWLAWVK